MTTYKNLHLATFPTGPLGCNCSIISSKKTGEALIIDPGQDGPAILRYLEEHRLKATLLIHTHAHFDHIGDSALIQKEHNCKLCLHMDDQFLYDALDEQGSYFGFDFNAPGKVDLYLQDESTLGFANPQDQELKNLLQVLHTPGHTPGSCCFYMETDEGPTLFSGDTLFKNSIGRTDLPGGNFDQIINSIQKRLYQKLPDETRVIPGHGPITTIHAEKRTNPFVKGRP